MSNLTYKRGQVEWALWRAFTMARSPDDGPPPIFKTRIKRLLDLDRDLDAATFGASPPCDFAFVAPAAITGFHATHGIVKHTMPSAGWQVAFSIIGAVAVGVTALMRLAAMATPVSTGRGLARG